MRKPIRSGFTLVELLVVITIIVVLIALLVPTLHKAQETMKATACLSNLRQISVAHSGYAYDYGGNYPLAQIGRKGWYPGGGGTYLTGGNDVNYYPLNNDPNVQSGMRLTWDVMIQPYLNSWKVLECPNDTQSGYPDRYPLYYQAGPFPQSGAFRGYFYRSYGLADDVCWWHSGQGDTDFAIEPRQSFFTLPALTVLAADTVQGVARPNDQQDEDIDWEDGGKFGHLGTDIQWRHCDDSRVNVSYLDGHAEAVYGHIFPGLNVSVPYFQGYNEDLFYGNGAYYTDNGGWINGWWPEASSQCDRFSPWPGH